MSVHSNFILLKKQLFSPPGVVEYKVPPGVDEYSSGNWLASVTRTRLGGIACAWEHAWRAMGEADIIMSSISKIKRKNEFYNFTLNMITHKKFKLAC